MEDAVGLGRQAPGLAAHLVHRDENAVELLEDHQEVVDHDADVSVVNASENGDERQGVMAAERMVGSHRDKPVRRNSLQAFHLQGDVHVFQGFLGEFNAGVTHFETRVEEILVQEFPSQPNEPFGCLFPQFAAEEGAYVDEVFVGWFHLLW